jgi:hypothetical protein
MNSNLFWPNALRFAMLILVQGLLLKDLPEVTSKYIQILIYPIAILLLPLEMAVPLLVLAGFFLGLAVDFFYGTIGVHAAASTFSAFLRPYIIKAFEPRAGFGTLPIPNVNLNWFLRYASIFYALHLFFYFTVEAFTFVYIGQITLQTISAWILSMVLVGIYMVIFNPKE